MNRQPSRSLVPPSTQSAAVERAVVSGAGRQGRTRRTTYDGMNTEQLAVCCRKIFPHPPTAILSRALDGGTDSQAVYNIAQRNRLGVHTVRRRQTGVIYSMHSQS